MVVEPEKSTLVEDDAAAAEDAVIDQDDEVDLIGDEEEEKKNKGAKEPASKKVEEVLITVTEENKHKYTINDVVMPLVGYKTQLPQNEDLQKMMIGIMSQDEITMTHFENQA